MKKICEFCNGTGQISYFKGVSRFLLSEEECPECGGMGFSLVANDIGNPTDQRGELEKNTTRQKKK